MNRPVAPVFVPVHRLSAAARRFFRHRPAGEPSEAWPAPLRAAARRITDCLDPPLRAPALRHLVRLLQSDAERAIVGRWLNAAPRLRLSDLRVVEEYAFDRDADLCEADVAAELESLKARTNGTGAGS